MMLSQAKISQFLQTSRIGRKIDCLDVVDSTNNECRRRSSEEEGMVVLSEQQTAGRGRLGRSWNSPSGKGIWMSLLLKPKLRPELVPRLTLIGAAAVCLALEDDANCLSERVKIKWPNDILMGGKKAGGILTEMQASTEGVQSVIIGIGLNVNLSQGDFPEELKSLATSLFIESGKIFERERIIAGILNHLEKLYEAFLGQGELGQTIDICRRRSAVIGREVKLIDRGIETEAKVIDLGSHGELLVKLNDGKVTSIVSGEISLRVNE